MRDLLVPSLAPAGPKDFGCPHQLLGRGVTEPNEIGEDLIGSYRGMAGGDGSGHPASDTRWLCAGQVVFGHWATATRRVARRWPRGQAMAALPRGGATTRLVAAGGGVADRPMVVPHEAGGGQTAPGCTSEWPKPMCFRQVDDVRLA